MLSVGIQVRPQEGEASASECIVRSGDNASLYSQRINVDGGLLLGASFRAGWSLRNRLFGPSMLPHSNLSTLDFHPFSHASVALILKYHYIAKRFLVLYAYCLAATCCWGSTQA